jgi:hypothetical protein
LKKRVTTGNSWEDGLVPAKQKIAKCMVVYDTIMRNVVAEHVDMMVECLPGIKAEHLHRVTEKRGLGSPQTVIIHVGTNTCEQREILIL